ncbi:MAG: glutathione S-transferase family protein [Thermoleophilaceae bacterium]
MTKLYVIPGSHPSIAAELMLQRKGIPYKRRDLVTAMHIPIVKSMGFPDRTVPALKYDGRKVQGTRSISRFLDEVQPEPALFPVDPERRAKVEEAERWGDEELQSVPRRMSWYALGRDRSGIRSFLEGYKLGLPTSVAVATAAPIIWAEQKINKASADSVRADLQRLPALLDHVDQLLADGVIGGAEPNAADFQIATSVRLLMAFEQLLPLVEARPAADFARRVVPEFPGRIGPGLPADWIPGR